ncbi:MAG: hypothetical protein LBD52_04860 [Prevotellaceae bacterium]|jgi:hypothetical protein|nr:hypothetical protein [Prevotellaceae bacterium]
MKLKLILSILCLSFLLCSCNKDELPVLDNNEENNSNGSGNGTVTTLNLRDFGADNTGAKDCSEAFKKLFAAMGQDQQVEVFIPAGRYKIAQRVVFDQSNFEGYDNNHGLMFRGAGEDVTEIICDNMQGGFYFNAGTSRITVTVQDLSFVTPQDNAGTAIEFNTKGQNPGDQHARMFQVRNVLIRGEKFDKGYFTNGILCYNAWYPMLENVKITGRYGGGTHKMNRGVLFEKCYSPLVDKFYFWGNATYGLYYHGGFEGFYPEDGIIDNSYFVGQENGIYIDLSSLDVWYEPAFHLTNTHIAYSRNGIYMCGLRQAFITSNLFYCQNVAGSYWHGNTDPVTSYEPRDVFCYRASDVLIANNQFMEPASPKRVCVDIGSASSNIVIQNNIFNMDATAIRNQSTAVSYALYNVFGGSPSFIGSGGFVKYNDETGTLNRVDYP